MSLKRNVKHHFSCTRGIKMKSFIIHCAGVEVGKWAFPHSGEDSTPQNSLKNEFLEPQGFMRSRGGSWALASVNFRRLPLFRKSHQMLDVRVLPVANAHCKPERDEKGNRWLESRVRPGSMDKFPGTRSRIQRFISGQIMQLEAIIISEVRKRKINTMWYHLNLESKLWHKWTYLWNRNICRQRSV